jgi:hypothetical protein
MCAYGALDGLDGLYGLKHALGSRGPCDCQPERVEAAVTSTRLALPGRIRETPRSLEAEFAVPPEELEERKAEYERKYRNLGDLLFGNHTPVSPFECKRIDTTVWSEQLQDVTIVPAMRMCSTRKLALDSTNFGTGSCRLTDPFMLSTPSRAAYFTILRAAVLEVKAQSFEKDCAGPWQKIMQRDPASLRRTAAVTSFAKLSLLFRPREARALARCWRRMQVVVDSSAFLIDAKNAGVFATSSADQDEKGALTKKEAKFVIEKIRAAFALMAKSFGLEKLPLLQRYLRPNASSASASPSPGDAAEQLLAELPALAEVVPQKDLDKLLALFQTRPSSGTLVENFQDLLGLIAGEVQPRPTQPDQQPDQQPHLHFDVWTLTLGEVDGLRVIPDGNSLRVHTAPQASSEDLGDDHLQQGDFIVGFGDTQYPGATPEELQDAIHHAATSARAHPEYIDTEITFLRPHDSGKSADAVLAEYVEYVAANIRNNPIVIETGYDKTLWKELRKGRGWRAIDVLVGMSSVVFIVLIFLMLL